MILFVLRILKSLNLFNWLRQRRAKRERIRQQGELLMWLAQAKAQLEFLASMVKIKQVGRNEPCPCGSGLKYKNCHGKER